MSRPNVVHLSADKCRAPLGPCDCGAEERWIVEQAHRVSLPHPVIVAISPGGCVAVQDVRPTDEGRR